VDFPKWVELWFMRNHNIASHISSVVEKNATKKTAVIFGYMHIPAIKKYLQEISYYKIVHY